MILDLHPKDLVKVKYYKKLKGWNLVLVNQIKINKRFLKKVYDLMIEQFDDLWNWKKKCIFFDLAC